MDTAVKRSEDVLEATRNARRQRSKRVRQVGDGAGESSRHVEAEAGRRILLDEVIDQAAGDLHDRLVLHHDVNQRVEDVPREPRGTSSRATLTTTSVSDAWWKAEIEHGVEDHVGHLADPRRDGERAIGGPIAISSGPPPSSTASPAEIAEEIPVPTPGMSDTTP